MFWLSVIPLGPMPYQGTLLPVSFASHVCLTSLRRLREKLAWCAASSEDWSSVFLCATGCTFIDWQLRLPYIGTWGFALSTRGYPATDTGSGASGLRTGGTVARVGG